MAIFHEHTREQQKRRRRLMNALPWLVIVALVLGLFAYRMASDNLREQGVLSIRSSILHAAEQCYAVEGAYPPSLDYLKEKYGIRVNENDYLVNYVAFAANVQPTVMVTPR